MNKPHMIEVPQSALTAMADRVIAGDLDVPHIIEVDGRWYADADDMRLYSARTSGAKS